MKIKFLPLIAVLFAATSIMTSCLDNDVEQITYTSETSITGFSLGTLHIDRVGKDKDGKDSAYVDTLDCSNYPFTINQLTREIENKDSLPYGTHIDKVITNVTYDAGILVYKPKGAEKDTLWTSTDSIDFSGDTYCTSTNKNSPIEFKVWAYSNAIGQAYKVKINVHQQVPDTIAWKKFDNSFSNRNLSKQKAVYANGKVYVFGENAGTHIEYSDVSDDNPKPWVKITDNVPADIDTYSATACAGYIYFLAGTNKQLYKLDVNSNEITSVGTETFEMLIGGNDIKSELYAVKEGEKGKKSGIYKENTWTEDANSFTLFPVGKPFFSNTTTASYNNDITTTIALCNNPTDNDTTALVFNRMSSDNKWEERMQNLPLPNLENVTMIYYDGKLYAFGGESVKPEVKPFSQFYCSTDNGLCWRPVTECMAFPAEFGTLYTTHHGNYSCAVTPKLENGTSRGNFIWIVWEDGSICRGRINRLGFTPKW
ncbi:DUF6242 domain-containing protein [Phocaeicola plebeius]|uniref:DUF6242 domain-containing protein n=1 Tax=Phocaeicola plebeius TaxID=310297 RepID=A0A921HHJ0_9BACT|nr:DUF6242 domain-containing protein [Phocaeicola plebeius]HJF80549.1 DUF6242 domain-containing protein [Phocaeicola plebeius]